MAVQKGIRAGKITKPYGLRGEVQLIVLPSLADNIQTGHPLFIDLNGQRVPFFIESCDRVAEDQALAKFEFIDSIEEARKVSGCEIFLDPETIPGWKAGLSELEDFQGYMVYDRKLGKLGVIQDYLPSEMNPVWIIEYAGRELMVPATRAFVSRIDQKNRALHLDLPEGICEL